MSGFTAAQLQQAHNKNNNYNNTAATLHRAAAALLTAACLCLASLPHGGHGHQLDEQRASQLFPSLQRSRYAPGGDNSDATLLRSTLSKSAMLTPPRTLTVGDSVDFFNLLQSPQFQDVYWEQFPVLIKTSNAFNGVLDLDKDVLQGRFIARGDKTKPPYVNIRFPAQGKFFLEEEGLRELGLTTGAWAEPQHIQRALELNLTLQLYGAQAWWPSVAELCRNMTRATGLPSNVNVYVTGSGRETSTAPHNDFTCNFMVQLAVSWWKK